MTYTAVGSATDIDVTVAADVKVKKSEKETKRTPNAANWNGDSYWRIDLAGTVELANFRSQPIEVEVVRYVLGNVGEAGQEGKAEMINFLEDTDHAAAPQPPWWGWYSWPAWWFHFNGVGKVSWKVKLDPGKPTTLDYAWHYYWR